MLALDDNPAEPLLSHVVWGRGVYLVPRNDGRLLIGATVEEKGYDAAITAGGLLALLEAAWRLVPAVEELPVAETWVGHRPGSRDDAPILGPSPLAGLVYATGHHRNGILLAPITAEAITRLIADDVLDESIRPFGIERFAPVAAAAE
jgi:glycine oxidase